MSIFEKKMTDADVRRIVYDELSKHVNLQLAKRYVIEKTKYQDFETVDVVEMTDAERANRWGFSVGGIVSRSHPMSISDLLTLLICELDLKVEIHPAQPSRVEVKCPKGGRK